MRDQTNHKKRFVIISGSGNTFVWFRLEMLQEIQKKGFSVYALSPEISEESLDILKSNNIRHIKIGLNRKSLNIFNLILSIYELVRIYKKIKPDIVFSYMHKSIIASNYASMILSIKNNFSMISGLGHVYYDQSPRGRIVRWATNILLRFALLKTKKVFFQNHDDLNVMHNSKVIHLSKTLVVNGSGVNLEKYPRTNLPNNRRFITITRLLESKGLLQFAKAAELVLKKYSDAEFIIYGYEDSHPDSITIDEITAWKTKYGIEFKGFCSNVYDALSNCFCYVLLSHHEGTPRTILEALSVGRPIITTDAPGCRETVQDGYNGFLVSINDHVSTAEAMIKLIKESIGSEMSENSRSMAENKYDVNIINKSLLSEMLDDR